MQTIILMGAPGSGKGTAAERLAGATGYRHLSTGDLLREAVKSDSPLGREARGYMESGALVPDPLILSLVREALARDGAEAKVMFDGFPRTQDQARALDAIVAELGGRMVAVFQLNVPEAVIVRRLSGRRVCPACAAVFNVFTSMKPKVEGVCDRCGGPLVQRPDDTEATICNRLEVYKRQSAPLVEYYREQGVLFDIDGEDREGTLASIQAVLAGR
jgi:adenylate kinase